MARLVLDRVAVRATSMGYAVREVDGLKRAVERAAKIRSLPSSPTTTKPKNPGHLSRNIESKTTVFTYKVRARVGVNRKVLYAMAVHNGASRHTITARRKPNLKFFWIRKGVRFTGPRVNHPGMEGKAYLTLPLYVLGTRRGFRVLLTDTGAAAV